MRTTALFLVLAAVACDRAGQPASNVTARDEKGVRIIENLSLTPDSTAWWVDTAGAVIIGELEGNAPYVFGRVAGVVRQSNGRIVVGDAQASEVRFFDAAGRFLHSVGGRGSGPGEYTYFSRVVAYRADTLVVIDREGGRNTVLDPEGKYVRSFRRTVEGAHEIGEAAAFADGSLLLYDFLNSCPGFRHAELCVDSVRWGRFSSDGNPLATFGVLPYLRSYHVEVSGAPGLAFDARFPQPYWAVQQDRFYWADAERFEIKVFDPSGKLERIVNVRHDRPVPTSNSFVPMRVDSSLTGERRLERERMTEAHRRAAPIPERLPAHQGLMVDRAGNMWVQEYPVERNRSIPERWFVIDTAGVLRYSVRLPVTVLPYWILRWRGEIGDDYVLGTHRDELGVESVRMYVLRKTPRARQ